MTRKPLFLVYDKRSEANTRTDTVPCAVRFDEDSSMFAGFEDRTERELLPYAIRPELLPTNDEPTVVDAHLSRQSPPSGRISEVRKASEPPPPPHSGPRHDRPDLFPPNELEKTVRLSQAPDPPLRRAAESNAEPKAPAAEPRPAERALLRSAARPVRRWILLLAALLAAVPAFLFGMSLGNGQLENAVRALVGSRAPAAAPPATDTARALAPAPAAKTAAAPAAASTPSPAHAAPNESRKVPAVRFEDLAVAEEAQPDPLKAEPAGRRPARPRGGERR
jgi:hypothetical protein